MDYLDEQQQRNAGKTKEMFLLTLSSQIPTELHQMDKEKHSAIFEPNVEDLWNLETIGIKSKVQSELFQRRRDDTIKKQLVKDIIEKLESADVNKNNREPYAVIGSCVMFLVHGTTLQQ